VWMRHRMVGNWRDGKGRPVREGESAVVASAIRRSLRTSYWRKRSAVVATAACELWPGGSRNGHGNCKFPNQSSVRNRSTRLNCRRLPVTTINPGGACPAISVRNRRWLGRAALAWPVCLPRGRQHRHQMTEPRDGRQIDLPPVLVWPVGLCRADQQFGQNDCRDAQRTGLTVKAIAYCATLYPRQDASPGSEHVDQLHQDYEPMLQYVLNKHSAAPTAYSPWAI